MPNTADVRRKLDRFSRYEAIALSMAALGIVMVFAFQSRVPMLANLGAGLAAIGILAGCVIGAVLTFLIVALFISRA